MLPGDGDTRQRDKQRRNINLHTNGKYRKNMFLEYRKGIRARSMKIIKTNSILYIRTCVRGIKPLAKCYNVVVEASEPASHKLHAILIKYSFHNILLFVSINHDELTFLEVC